MFMLNYNPENKGS